MNTEEEIVVIEKNSQVLLNKCGFLDSTNSEKQEISTIKVSSWEGNRNATTISISEVK